MKIIRRPGTQDISWFLDQYQLKRLDLDPPYQRRSVWTSKDRRYFVDTLFRGYPCPPIYLHKTIDLNGSAIYHVVDGKQRLETLIRFSENKIRIPIDFGDDRLNNKRWKDVIEETEIRNRFLNYPFVVEYFDDVDSGLVNEIFERMNKNSRKLTPQELRNARYDGWFAAEIESEVDEPIWKKVGLVTPGRARRMADMQFLSELFMIIIYRQIHGFEHGLIDQTYADFEDIQDADLNFDIESFRRDLADARGRLAEMDAYDGSIASYLSSVSNLYVLWAVLVLDNDRLPSSEDLAARYKRLLDEVGSISKSSKDRRIQTGVPTTFDELGVSVSADALEYHAANQSATTELPQRTARLQALRRALQIEN